VCTASRGSPAATRDCRCPAATARLRPRASLLAGRCLARNHARTETGRDRSPSDGSLSARACAPLRRSRGDVRWRARVGRRCGRRQSARSNERRLISQGAHQVVREIFVKQYAHLSSGFTPELERGDGLFAANGEETVGETRRGYRRPQCSQQRPNRDPGANKHGRAAQNLRVAVNDWRFVGHGCLQPSLSMSAPGPGPSYHSHLYHPAADIVSSNRGLRPLDLLCHDGPARRPARREVCSM